MDGSLMAALPQGQEVIRVISTNGVTKVVKIADCSTCEEVMRVTLRKFALREDHERNYCFWVLDGFEPDPRQCRRLGDTELWRIIKDHKRPERNRLILRRVPAGEPGEPELQVAGAGADRQEESEAEPATGRRLGRKFAPRSIASCHQRTERCRLHIAVSRAAEAQGHAPAIRRAAAA
jgi:mitogen-activated protein kinase kinase kinase